MDQSSPVQSRLVAGRYRLLSPLGSGGMGTVWRAEDVVLGREVAVKEVTFPHGLSDEDREVLRERTRREARAAARLDHPSAVTVFDVVEEDGAPYLVMELVEARTLSQVIQADGPLSPQRTAQVGLDLLGALETAHAQGIVHRDVKPGNVLLCPDEGTNPGRVVLTDFGIASSSGDSSITSTGLLLGSPSYIAPERARGLSPGPESDLWSLGATLFTAVEGRPPYDAGQPLATVTAVVTGEHEPFIAAGPLAPILEGLLARDPGHRLDAAGARKALRPVAASRRTGAAPVPAPDSGRESNHTSVLPLQDVREAAAPPAAPAAPEGRHAAEGDTALPPPAPLTRPPLVRRPPPAAPPPPPAGRRRRTPLAVFAAVLLLVAVGVLGFSLSGGPDGDRGPDASPGASVEPSRGASAAPRASAAALPLPAGWTRYTDPDEGWSIGVPPGYDRGTRDALVQFRDERARRTLRVDFSTEPKSSALAAWQDLSPKLAGQLGGYQELRLEKVDYKGLDAADLEFTYFDQTTLRVLDRTFVSGTRTEAFALYWQVRAEDWDAALPIFEQIAQTFQPRA